MLLTPHLDGSSIINMAVHFKNQVKCIPYCFPNVSIKFRYKNKILDFIDLVTPYFEFLSGSYHTLRVGKPPLSNFDSPLFWKGLQTITRTPILS